MRQISYRCMNYKLSWAPVMWEWFVNLIPHHDRMTITAYNKLSAYKWRDYKNILQFESFGALKVCFCVKGRYRQTFLSKLKCQCDQSFHMWRCRYVFIFVYYFCVRAGIIHRQQHTFNPYKSPLRWLMRQLLWGTLKWISVCMSLCVYPHLWTKWGVERLSPLAARVVSFSTLEMQNFAGPAGPGPIQTGLGHYSDMSVSC